MADTPPDHLSNNPRSPHFDLEALQRGVGVRFKGRERADVAPAVGDLALGGGDGPRDRLEQRRLAGAVRSHERDELALGDVERDVGQRVQAAVVHAETRHAQHHAPAMRASQRLPR